MSHHPARPISREEDASISDSTLLSLYVVVTCTAALSIIFAIAVVVH